MLLLLARVSNLLSLVFLKDKYTNKIAMNPSPAAKYLCTTSGIALLISYGNNGYLLSATAMSASFIGKTTKP
jgi:hypothetical protein